MALINCPNCNKTISDKARACVGCGFLLSDDANTEGIARNCVECGAELDSTNIVCANCGCPVDGCQSECDAKKKRKKRSNKKWIWILLAVLMVVVLISACLFSSWKNEQYHYEMCCAVEKIMTVSAEVETVGNQICSVWYSAIWEKDNPNTFQYTSEAEDFNEALNNLFADEAFANTVTAIRSQQTEVDEYFGALKNPPRKFDDAYDDFKELYYAYSDYADFVISCRGSYNTYTEDMSEKAAEVLEKYREIKVELLG